MTYLVISHITYKDLKQLFIINQLSSFQDITQIDYLIIKSTFIVHSNNQLYADIYYNYTNQELLLYIDYTQYALIQQQKNYY